MAKKYDFKKAKAIIEENLLFAEMGMEEDFEWTYEEVWNNEDGYIIDLDSASTIAGIPGSDWATPILRLTFVDDEEKDFEVHDNGTSNILTKPIWV